MSNIKEEEENNNNIINIERDENKEEVNNNINIDYDKPFYKDESKTVYKINQNPIIKEISIIKTKNIPPKRAYLTVDYSKNNNSIICVGGTNIFCEQCNKITEYNNKENIWNYWNNNDQIEFDLELSGHSSNLIRINNNEQIFIFGGYDNWKKEFTAQSYMINITNKTFEKINYNINNNEKNREFPLPRTYHTSNYDEDEQIIYIYGGTDMNINHIKNNNFQSVWAFYVTKRYWKKISISNPSPLGVPRGHSSVLLDNKLYIFGGVILFKKFLNKLFIIDLNTKKIEHIKENNKTGIIPKPIAFHSAVLVDNEKMLIHGGLDKNYKAVNDCYIFYFKDFKFDKINIPLIPKLFGHKIVTKDKNQLYIVGGMESFKYVGDESLISKNEEKEKDNNLSNKYKEQFEFIPMANILEIVLNNEEEKREDNKIINKRENKDNKYLIKKRRWKKLFY